MQLSFNPHVASAWLLAMRDTTMSKTDDEDFISCLPYYVSNKPEWLPAKMAEEYQELFDAWKMPLVTIDAHLIGHGGAITHRIHRMMMDNRPPIFPAQNKPMYMAGATSIGEPSLMYRGGCPEKDFTRMLSTGEVDFKYKLPLTRLQQHLMCCGIRQVRRGGASQDSTTGKRQTNEGPIVGANVAAHATQICMLGKTNDQTVDTIHLHYRMAKGSYWFNDALYSPHRGARVGWGFAHDDVTSENTADQPKLACGNDRFWNGSAGIVAMHVKKGSFKRRFSFVKSPSERNVDRNEWNGSFGFNDNEMYHTLKDNIDVSGFPWSMACGNWWPVSPTKEEPSSKDTPAKDLMYVAMATSPIIQDAFCRIINLMVGTVNIFYDMSDAGRDLAKLWFADPAVRGSDADLQELKLRVIAHPDNIVSYGLCAYLTDEWTTLGHVMYWGNNAGSQLGENATAASTASVNIELLTRKVPLNEWSLHMSMMLAGAPWYVTRENLEGHTPRADAHWSNANGTHIPFKFRPMLGDPGVDAETWDSNAQGVVNGPDYLFRDWSHGGTQVGSGNWLACPYNLLKTRDGKPNIAITAMGSVVRLEEELVDNPSWFPWFISGDSFGVASIGVTGVFEDNVPRNTYCWGATGVLSDYDVHDSSNGFMIAFFTNQWRE